MARTDAALPTVLGAGAWLKNAACRLDRTGVAWSPLHGDLGDPQACIALEASLERLLHEAPEPVQAIAHDLHPDFHSTRLALQWAERLGVPAIGVQHHHAHIAAVMAEHGVHRPVIGLALDGVGLGTDGTAWGGELLGVDRHGCERLGHLQTLALPGGDAAAREPWRVAASVLHLLGREDEIADRYAAAVGSGSVRLVQQMLARGFQSPPTSSTGRWFDAAAAALGLSVRQTHEAEAAIALEQRAARALAAGREPVPVACTLEADGVLDPSPLLAWLFDQPGADEATLDDAAATFHVSLASALADWAAAAARYADVDTVCLGGGCFLNAVLVRYVTARLERHQLRVLRPLAHSCGDAGLALGQAWVAAQRLQYAAPPSVASSCA